MTATMLVIENDPSCPLGLFAGWLSDAGVRLDIRRGYATDAVPSDARSYGGVIVLGGSMSAHDDASCHWLATTKTLIRAAVLEQVPLLGICLGQQLTALALGGSVARNPAGRARGLTEVPLTDTGRADPMLGPRVDGARAIQWNSDIVSDVPAGSTVLATSPDGSPQAIRFAPRAWGVQFHPEASAGIFRSWVGDNDGEGRDAALEIARAEAVLADTWQPLAERFAGMCGAGH